MADFSSSPNMNLPIPNVGVAPGPEWATLLNSCLTLLDGHSHVAGSGVLITPSAMNINSDLTMAQNNLTDSRSLRLTLQSMPLSDPTDLACLYASGVDLYFNDGNGNQIQITQSGGVAGSPGSISNLTSPASAAYVAGTSTFVWQSDANTPANVDGASVLLRNLTANSKALTLNPPAAMGANFSLTLPSLPAATGILTIDVSGNISGANVFPLASSAYGASSILTAAIADGQVTRPKQAAVGQQLSSSSGTFSTTSTSAVAVTNLTVTLTTTGRPVVLAIVPSDGVAGSITVNGNTRYRIYYARTGTSSASVGIFDNNSILTNIGGSNFSSSALPSMHVDPIAAGTYSWQVMVQVLSSTGTQIILNNWKLIAYEL